MALAESAAGFFLLARARLLSAADALYCPIVTLSAHMQRKTLGLLAFLALLGAGCGASSTTNGNVNTNANVNAPVVASSTDATTNVNAPAPAPAPTAAPKPTTTAAKTSFLVEADDAGFSPVSGTARKGSTVTVTFKVRTSNVIYNGLSIRSNKYDLGSIKGGTSKSVTFTADANITFSSFWPTGAYRGAWTLYVK